MIGTGGSDEKMTAEMASVMIEGAGEIGAAHRIIKEAARATGEREIIGELKNSCVFCFVLQLLILNSGVPVVGTSDLKSDKSPENKAKREAATADALAKAKAMVEAEQKKSAKSDKSKVEAEKEEPANKDDVATGQKAKVESGAEQPVPDSKSEEVDRVESKKRAREGDDDAGPEMKKVDSKAEPVQTNGHS
jgi:hypothetical protein